MAVYCEVLEVCESDHSYSWRDHLNRHPWIGHFLILFFTLTVVLGSSDRIKGEFIGYIVTRIGMLLFRLTNSTNETQVINSAFGGFFVGIFIILQLVFYALRRHDNKLLFCAVLFIEYVIVAAILHGIYCRESVRCVELYGRASLSRQEFITKCGAPLYYLKDDTLGVYVDGNRALITWFDDNKLVTVNGYGYGIWSD